MRYLIFLLLATCYGCGSPAKPGETATAGSSKQPGSAKSKNNRQLNLTVLLDLSDRIDPRQNPATPSHLQRDTALVNCLVRYFLAEMQSKGTNMSKGKMRVIFYPPPKDADLLTVVSRLNIDLSKMENKSKKEVYDNMRGIFADNIASVYEATIKAGKWPGSDIWRFFKNDVKDYAVDKDADYRNVLVIFTDGYIYHNDSKDKRNNRYAYLTGDLLQKYKLRNNNSWQQEMDRLDFGLIASRNDLDRLEVLVLEVSPSAAHRNDEDLIRHVLKKWFTEMGVKRAEVFNTDIPEYTRQRITAFMEAE